MEYPAARVAREYFGESYGAYIQQSMADRVQYNYGRTIAEAEYNETLYSVRVGFPRGILQRAGVSVSYDGGETWHNTDHSAIGLTGRYSVDKELGRL